MFGAAVLVPERDEHVVTSGGDVDYQGAQAASRAKSSRRPGRPAL